MREWPRNMADADFKHVQMNVSVCRNQGVLGLWSERSGTFFDRATVRPVGRFGRCIDHMWEKLNQIYLCIKGANRG